MKNQLTIFFVYNIIVNLCGIINAQHPLPNCPPTGTATLAHPNSCSEYFLCVNGNRILRPCAPNTFFDPITLSCGIRECNVCFAHPEDAITFVPDLADCSKYYVCIGHNQQEHSCSDNLLFNPQLNSCDSANNVNCAGASVTLTTSATTTPATATTTTTPITVTTPCPPTTLPPLRNITCSITSEDTIEFIAHPQSCSWYFACSCNGAELQSCGCGLVFDVNEKKCILRQGATCLLDYQPMCQSNLITFEPHPNSCDHYFICIERIPYLHTCSPNLVFDTLTRKCNDRHLSVCAR